MPIKPENRHRYPPDWKERRAAVLERAKHCCELCFVPNKARIHRHRAHPGGWRLAGEHETRPHLTRIVLTVHHLDPTHTSHDVRDLIALCQRCHLRLDSWRRRNRAAVVYLSMYRSDPKES